MDQFENNRMITKMSKMSWVVAIPFWFQLFTFIHISRNTSKILVDKWTGADADINSILREKVKVELECSQRENPKFKGQLQVVHQSMFSFSLY